jgi:hypothetical protein
MLGEYLLKDRGNNGLTKVQRGGVARIKPPYYGGVAFK